MRIATTTPSAKVNQNTQVLVATGNGVLSTEHDARHRSRRQGVHEPTFPALHRTAKLPHGNSPVKPSARARARTRARAGPLLVLVSTSLPRECEFDERRLVDHPEPVARVSVRASMPICGKHAESLPARMALAANAGTSRASSPGGVWPSGVTPERSAQAQIEPGSSNRAPPLTPTPVAGVVFC